ncbi:EpsG family protein [Cytobacillus firmus]|uniref:EpsG family protein n=1 Tax=Cytobacillus firmus TaxID=1399 RepID=A0AA46SHX7_CYTFI|nr:EpsG family protein [Cytobacillus firmus]UYG93834.1 EpsG family protein [Cytobacillus firmus]
MTYYFLLIFLWGLVGFIIQTNNNLMKNRGKIHLFFGSVSLILIMGLRDETVGTDIISYKNEFENADYYLNNLLRPTELGYSFFNNLINTIGFNFQMYLLIISIIIIGSISLLYYRYSKNVLMSFYLHFTIGLFAMSMSGIRQILAVSITIIAFIFLMKNKKLLFFLFTCLAYTFHNSAIAFLITIFFKNIKITKKSGFIIFGIASLMFFMKGWLTIIVQYLTPDKYLKYLEISFDTNINPLVILVNMAIPLACLLLWPKSSEGKESNILSIIFILSCINFLISFLSVEIKYLSRISFYFMVYNTVLIPNVINNIKSKEIKTIALIFCIFLPLVQFIMVTPGSSLGIDNYKFFWE